MKKRGKKKTSGILKKLFLKCIHQSLLHQSQIKLETNREMLNATMRTRTKDQADGRTD